MIKLPAFLELSYGSIEHQLNLLVPEIKDGYFPSLYQAARYSLLEGGKRIRPLLTLATAMTFGVDLRNALVPACALEMVHCYSLIHDDLPCMDDDDFRRGKPSLHKAFAEGLAVLTGDFLLTKSFQVISEDSFLSDLQKVCLIRLLSRRAGAEGMIGGQIMDIEAENKKIDLETLQQVHLHKTGRLLSAAVEFGGILANLPQSSLALLEQFGLKIGLAFQILDDVYDVTESKTHGKKVASDQINGKTTYVTLLGVDESRHLASELLDQAILGLEVFKNEGIDVNLLQEMANWIIKKILK